ncbi:vitellogenin-like [Vombatus ursinus]|uniref:vitellogenin-like n=1 Tax=Vombatus ursinus TaxID=29139 RepID=UPI000FFD353B|nr:vitellogenin-like [Vombatus ursinus]
MADTPENPEQEASCMTECAGPGAFYFSKGARYSYRYSSSSSTSLWGSGTQKSSLGLEGLAILDAVSGCHAVLRLQDIQVKSSLESKEEPGKESESLRMILEKFPLSFVFRDGKIPKICPQQGDPSWVVNIKRGVLSLLQSSPGTTIPETIDEVDVLGKCPTTYERKGSRLLKTKDLNQCSLRRHRFTFFQSEVLPGMPSSRPILASKLECYQSFQEGLLEDTACTEFDVVRPFSEEGNGVQTRTHSTLSLLHVKPQALSNKADYGKFYVSSLLYEWEGLGPQSQVADVAESVRKLCLAQATSFETTELFMELVFELRGLSAEALMDLWQRSSFKCRDNWQPLVDALPSCGTEACVTLMKELIMSGDVENEEAESFLWSLAFVPQPTAGMIHLLLPLLQSPAVSSSAFLSISALVHSLCMAGGACERLPGVSSLMKILKEALGENCSSQVSKDSGRLQLMLKAIGNAGMAAAPLTPILSSCAAMKDNAPEIRLAAIQAFRRIPCSVKRSGLAQLYQATEEDAEIRITAYYFFMKCPSEEAFALVRETQAAEQSTQVGAFVWSHLSQLLETDDPLKHSLRDSLPDDILSQEFESETWKHSSYSDVTFRSGSSSMGANLEATLLFSPASFLPRSLMANLTIHVMGRAVNILELGLRLENAEKLAYRVFGRQPVMAAFRDDDKKSETKPDTDMELADGVNEKSGLARAGCPGGGHSKMKELQEKVTQRWGKRRDLQCGLSLKIFGNELSFVDCGAVRSHMKRYSLNLAELTVRLLKGQEVQINRRLSLATEELSFPTVSGLPVQLALNASAAIHIRIRGTVDFKQLSDFSLEGYIKPSALIQIAAQMGVAGFHGKAGVKWVTGIRSSTSLDGGIMAKRGQELKMFLNTPEESMELVNFSSKLYLMTVDGVMNIDRLNSAPDLRSCTGEEASHIWGWQMCSEVSYPAQVQPFSLAVPISAAVTLKKQDKGLQQYLLEAACAYIPQVGQNRILPHPLLHPYHKLISAISVWLSLSYHSMTSAFCSHKLTCGSRMFEPGLPDGLLG